VEGVRLPHREFGLEPSGGYERGIIRALLAAGLSVRRINPNKLRQFARARGVLAKNDRLDARLIAEYVAIMPTRVVQRDAAVERLAEIDAVYRQSSIVPLLTTCIGSGRQFRQCEPR
jgi:transposase